MPKNNRESMIYSVLMCFVMVLWMSIYNVMLRGGGPSLHILEKAWLGFPFGFIFAFVADWIFVSKFAKGFAFKFLVTTESNPLKMMIAISCCMVIPMVLIMSLYGALELCLATGDWNSIGLTWIKNIGMNIIMALPFQIIIAGPVVRKVFRGVFPEGKVLE